MLLKLLCPRLIIEKVQNIDLDDLYAQGFRAIIFDLDNTLVSWRRWSVTRELYLLRGAGSVFTFVPRRAFASEDAESEFRALLARHLAATRRLV